MEIEFHSAELKKQLFKIYNDINKEIYGFGVVELKINLTEDMMIFITRHNRVPALQALEQNHPDLKQSVDSALFSEFKLRLRARLQENLHINPKAMLRDYDASYLLAVTVVVL